MAYHKIGYPPEDFRVYMVNLTLEPWTPEPTTLSEVHSFTGILRHPTSVPVRVTLLDQDGTPRWDVTMAVGGSGIMAVGWGLGPLVCAKDGLLIVAEAPAVMEIQLKGLAVDPVAWERELRYTR